MRQAMPDDVFEFVTLAEIRSEWDAVQKYLGTSRAMWSWLLDSWKEPSSPLKSSSGLRRLLAADLFVAQESTYRSAVG